MPYVNGTSPPKKNPGSAPVPDSDVIKIDYFIGSATYGFSFTSCKTLENEGVSAANE